VVLIRRQAGFLPGRESAFEVRHVLEPERRDGERRQRGGAGLPIVAQCSDRFAVRERRASGTEIWMRFVLID
jgi:anti-sigma regulatory factor (Ser/Thr protein kinase)